MSEYFRKPIVKTLMLKGQEGQSIKGIEKTSTDGFVDTYTITLTDGTTSTFTVTNGREVSSIRKTGTSGLVDTYTIEFNDGTTSTFTITNGKAISSIRKAETSGLVDTYKIKFNDGTESTFTVTNGETDYKPAVYALGQRIDNLILSSGNESSAEVIDARTGYDGTVYDTLGTAIREQIGDLDDAVFNVIQELKDYTSNATILYDKFVSLSTEPLDGRLSINMIDGENICDCYVISVNENDRFQVKGITHKDKIYYYPLIVMSSASLEDNSIKKDSLVTAENGHYSYWGDETGTGIYEFVIPKGVKTLVVNKFAGESEFSIKKHVVIKKSKIPTKISELEDGTLFINEVIDARTGYDGKVYDTLGTAIRTQINNLKEEKIDNPSTGSVGQILEIESVDEKGKPKTYKSVDKPTPSGEVSDEQISSAVSEYMANNPIEENYPTVPEWAKSPRKPTYTASEVGADATGTAESKVSAHNVSDTAHNDIRLLVQGLTERLNALADSDDTTLDRMSEIVSYIKYNRSMINGIDTNKVDVSDIVNNLTSNNTNKPLSAKQGRVLKSLIDGIVIPEKLPNPYPLTFAGGASGSYDGSEALTINIPSGGDASTYYVTPEQFGAIGDGVTDDSEAFRQAIETEKPIVCMTGKDYYFANEIVTSKTRINIDGNYSHFTAFRLKINLNEDETNWKTSYPHPDSVIQNVYFMNKNNMDYCIKTGIPIKFVNIDVYYYDLWLKNYGDYMDYMVFDNLAINSRPSNEHYCIELSYLGDNHVFRECRFGGYDTNINYVQVSGCKAVNFIDCVINGNVIAYQSVVNLNGCHFENNGQIICGDTNVNSVINFNGCFFYDQYSVTPGKNVFYNGCGFLVNYRTYGGQNDYMALNTRDCIILCGAELANSNSNVIIDELRKKEYPNVVYSGNKVVFTPVVLKHTAKKWGLSAGTYTYKFFQSCNPYSIDYGDPDNSTGNESVTVDADTSAIRFRSNYDTYPEMFIHAYRTSPDGSIKNVVIPINGNYIYDYGETLNGIMWKNVTSIPTPKSTTAVYKNGIYYSGKNYTNARNCICVNKTNGEIVWINENGSLTTK